MASGRLAGSLPDSRTILPARVPMIRRLKDIARKGLSVCGLDYQRCALLQGGQTFRLGAVSTGTSIDIGWRRNSQLGTFVGLRWRGIRTVLDVGANDGGFAWQAMIALPEAHIYSFEPLPSVYAELKRQIRRRRAARVQAHNLALGDHERELEMFLHPEETGTSSFLPSAQVCREKYTKFRNTEVVKVKMDTLDGWLAKSKAALEPEILLKLDVQGYEDRVLKGASQTLRQARACLLEVNFDCFYEGQPTFEALGDYLRDFGYSFAGVLQQDYAEDGHVAAADALFIR